MHVSSRLVQVKSLARAEDELPTYTPHDIEFYFADVVRPVGLILNLTDPTECFVLFPQATPLQDVYKLNEDPS